MQVKVIGNRTSSKSRGYDSKMGTADRDSLWREKESLEAQTQNVSYSSNPDRAGVEARIKQINDMLGADADLESKGRQRGKMEERIKFLVGEIKKRVPPMSIQRAKPGTPEYNKAITWGVEAMKPETTKMCEEFQSLSRSLDPDNPDAGSIEALMSES